jgi:hypothetical protein
MEHLDLHCGKNEKFSNVGFCESSYQQSLRRANFVYICGLWININSTEQNLTSEENNSLVGLAQDINQRRALVNSAMNLKVV